MTNFILWVCVSFVYYNHMILKIMKLLTYAQCRSGSIVSRGHKLGRDGLHYLLRIDQMATELSPDGFFFRDFFLF